MIDSTHDGYLKVNGEWFKLWDHTFEIYDLQAKGQNYENISFQWSHI